MTLSVHAAVLIAMSAFLVFVLAQRDDMKAFHAAITVCQQPFDRADSFLVRKEILQLNACLIESSPIHSVRL